MCNTIILNADPGPRNVELTFSLSVHAVSRPTCHHGWFKDSTIKIKTNFEATAHIDNLEQECANCVSCTSTHFIGACDIFLNQYSKRSVNGVLCCLQLYVLSILKKY